MKKAFIFVVGCERRNIDGEKISAYLKKNKYKIIKKPKDADVIFFIACGASTGTTEYCFRMINKLKKYKGELIIGGCIPEIEKERLKKNFNGKTLVTKEIDKIDEIFPEHKVKFKDIEDKNKLFDNLDISSPVEIIKYYFRKIKILYNPFLYVEDKIIKHLIKKVNDGTILYRELTKNPYYIRVSWGCWGNCSYCAIKKGVGKFKSKPVEECVSEFKKGLDMGYKHFILIGDDVGGYGLEIRSNLPELLYKITDIKGDYDISIRDLNPRWITRYIDDLEKIVSTQRIINMDVPLQSGSYRILKLMRRYTDRDKIKDAILRLKKASRSLRINTFIIVGFPTETEDEFKQTMSFLRDVKIDGGTFFPFSCKTGTPAEKIEPKVPNKEIWKRYAFSKKFLRSIGYSIVYKKRTRLFIFQK